MKLNNILAQRADKTVYREGNLVYKVFNENYSTSDVLNEALNQAVVFETGFAVPAFRDIERIDGKWAIVMDYVEGDTVLQQMEQNPTQMTALLTRMVDIQMDMHRHKASRLRHHTDKMHAKISASGLEATARYELHTRLDGLPRHSKLCHGDFTPNNVILQPDGGYRVIDWSHATQGNASADAARTYLRFKLAARDEQFTQTLGNLDELAEQYLRLFCQKSDTARQYVERWMAIVAASQLGKGIETERELLTQWANVVEYY